MKVTVEELSPSKRVLHVELPSERVADRLEATFKEWGEKLQLPGLRRGRVPREIIRSRFQAEVHDEVLRALIPIRTAKRSPRRRSSRSVNRMSKTSISMPESR